jgi:EAL domain-containing protein (putative c-di-GMP-specific phosphodiesterase class I)
VGKNMTVDETNGEFIYYFQPIISTDHGRVSDVEALVRFQQKDGTLIPPMAFIPQMESDGTIDRFTRRYFPLLVEAIRQLRTISPQIRLSFNLSPQSLQLDDCAAFLLQTLEQGGGVPEAMQLEVLETGILQQNGNVERNLK